MGSLVGNSVALSTWGKFRCAWCLQGNYDVTSVTNHDITYGSGQKAAADGSGLIRWRPRPLAFPFMDFVMPSIFNTSFVVFPIGGANRIFTDNLQASATSPTGFESNQVTDEARAQLTGELVTFFDTRTTAITNTFWDEGTYTWVGPVAGNTNAGDVTAIGKLTAF
jgi:hypothetical protein